jgi:glycosyltransferase involved in cell wall biosynthesis
MKISVILTTYNATEWLEKVLWGYAAQHFTDFELVIADDGSNRDTVELIERVRDELGLGIQHVWQEDRGFRKCRILNKAILHARYDYLVFSDGDCIPRADFLAVHAARARRGTYLSGSYYKLPMSTSEIIGREDIESGRCFDRAWLMAHGLPRSSKKWKLSASPRMARWLNRLDPTRCNFKGSNGSAWLQDVIGVNGFNEDMHYGGLDREFGVRLANLGIRPVQVRYDAIVLHLDHPRGYRDPHQMAANKEFRLDVERRRLTRTASGIAELLTEGYPVADHAAARRHLPLLRE